ncbi:MAG TPA: hypothetical protein VFA65_20135 [Bryobacteraceae bacterium]|nr:hypothetical protein [Bryobacteraceae bacterium]
MAVEFLDNYSTKGFWFKEQTAQRSFCLSGAGQENRTCLPGFAGSVAIARYRIRSSSKLPKSFGLMERVRTIDQDSRLMLSAPFERTIVLEDGVASDVQAFGYDSDSLSPDISSELAATNGPWRLLRQDIYLRDQDSLFLVLHWKHSLSAIRLFDVIPGSKTRLIAEPNDTHRKGR